MAASARPHRVAVLVFEHPSLFEMAVPCEVWGIDRTAVGVPRSEVRVCTPDPSPLHTDVGYTVTAPHGLEALRWADTVVVPAAPKPSGQWAAPDTALAALRAARRRGARIASLCSGAFTLAEAGLLDGRRATTHWMYTDAFRARFPLVELDPSVLYVGGDGIYTSAGTAAGIDLCLHLVRLDHGAEVANIVARRMVVPPHREGGQAQYVDAPVAELGREDPLAAVVTWAMSHLDRDLSVNDLARRAFMAPRTFARRFRASTGSTPSLRQHFGRVVGTSPHAYRSRFRRAS